MTGYLTPADGTVSTLDVESAGIPTWFDRMTGSLYGSYFGINFNGVNSTELAEALTEANRNGANWSRFTIGRAYPRTDKNLLMQKLHGIRLW